MGEVANILPEIRFIRMISFGPGRCAATSLAFPRCCRTLFTGVFVGGLSAAVASCTDLVALDLGTTSWQI
jgi:hypothetical protein